MAYAQPSVERCPWIDQTELGAALRGEVVAAALIVRDCGASSARLEARWDVGARATTVDLSDVPEPARTRAVALLLADLAALGPEPPAVDPQARATASGPSAPVDAQRSGSEDSDGASSSGPFGASDRAAPSDPIMSSEASSASEGASASAPRSEGLDAPRPRAAVDPSGGPSVDDGLREAVPTAPRWDAGLGVEVEAQGRFFWARTYAFAPGLRVGARWRWISLGVGALGNRPSTQSGDVGALALLGRLALRPLHLALERWRVGAELFAEGGLVRVQGHPHHADTLGSLARVPAIGGGARLTLGRALGRLTLGLSLEVGYLRGMVGLDETRPDLSSCALAPCEPTYPEAGGLHGPSVAVGLVLAR
ncbi:MAG: hypothetical protein KF901_02265 [Myxococcales bacterium]|nr:hypothetical protein [Myxococcales bacterium]